MLEAIAGVLAMLTLPYYVAAITRDVLRGPIDMLAKGNLGLPRRELRRLHKVEDDEDELQAAGKRLLDRRIKVAERRIRVYEACQEYLHWTAPLMVLVFPSRWIFAVLSAEYGHGAASGAYSTFMFLIYAYWTCHAWRETRRGGPRWRKRGRKVWSKVKATAAGLKVVPVRVPAPVPIRA